MRRLLILVGVMVIGILLSSPAIASLGGGISLSYFSPNYGKINEDLESTNQAVGTDLGLGSGLGYGVNLSYDLSSSLRVRGEYFSFSSKTSDSYSISEEDWQTSGTIEGKVNLGALILSGIYRFSPDKAFCPYAGVGVGLFSTQLKAKSEWEDYYYDYWLEEWVTETGSSSDSDNASPIGFQALVGAEYRIGESLFVAGEARYISAKAEGLFAREGYEGTDVDWSGISIGLVVILKF